MGDPSGLCGALIHSDLQQQNLSIVSWFSSYGVALSIMSVLPGEHVCVCVFVEGHNLHLPDPTESSSSFSGKESPGVRMVKLQSHWGSLRPGPATLLCAPLSSLVRQITDNWNGWAACLHLMGPTQQPHKESTAVTPILQIGKLRHRMLCNLPKII